jgi:hypothetical protein
MMLDPAERLVKHSSTAGLGRRAHGLGVHGFEVRATRTWRLARRTRSGMTVDGNITDTGLSDIRQSAGQHPISAEFDNTTQPCLL